MATLTITRGAPGSGKTTWARDWVAQDESHRARVNRDDVRTTTYGRGAPLPVELERAITAHQVGAVEALLREGLDVVVDDTVITSKYVSRWRDTAARCGAEFEIKDFSQVPLAVCLERNAGRTVARVPDEIVREMHHRLLQSAKAERTSLPPAEPYTYVADRSQHPAWLVDIDGTLAHMSGRGPFEWHRVGEDAIVPAVKAAVNALAHDHAIILMSGRDAVCMNETHSWLALNRVIYDGLHMRPVGDTRKDAIVKLELFRTHVADRYNVVGVLDDRDQVVSMWRAIGLPCFQVAPGAF